MECNLTFEKSEIAPKLRRERSLREGEISGLPEAHPDIAGRVNETKLEPIDISVEPSYRESTSLSEPPADFQNSQCMRKEICAEIEEQDTPDPDEFCTKEPLEKGKEKERSENHLFFTTGGLRIPDTRNYL